MHFRETFSVRRAAAEAFAFAADFRNLPHWDPSVTSVAMSTPEPVGLGTRYDVALSFLGLPSHLAYEVVEWEPGHRAVLRASNLFVTATDTVRVEARDSGARVEWDARIEFAFPASLFDGVFAALFRSNVVEAVHGLRRAIDVAPAAPAA